MSASRLFWLAALAALVALSCNAPLVVPSSVDRPLPQEIWRTATAPAFFLPTGAAGTGAGAAGTPEPTQDPITPLIVPTVSTPDGSIAPLILYYSQAGDTLPALAVRFGVLAEEINSPNPIPAQAFINPGQLLLIPDRLQQTTASQRLLPDSEFVYSPSAIDFDVDAFAAQQGGYINQYSEFLSSTGLTSGVDILKRVAIENSINPRLLLALLEYQAGWLSKSGDELNLAQKEYPMGLIDSSKRGLYKQLVWAVKELSIGYYGWREGMLTEINLADGTSLRLAPDLNAGTVGLQYFFSHVKNAEHWGIALKVEAGLPAVYERYFGNPWVRAMTVEPLFPPDLAQPALTLPFVRGQLWSFSGGPHGAWEREGSQAALDFAPGSAEPGCVESFKRVLAAAPGLVTRSGNGVVMLDLDGDGHEQTGWGLLYLHISANNGDHPAPAGAWMDQGGFIGYPSCEGGLATGTHIHIARKFNGEWIAADGPIPFVLGGWTAHAGWRPYEGTLTRNGQTVIANPLGTFTTRITRGPEDP